MDLTRDHPRPGEERLGGYAWLARAIDKAKAYAEGLLGDYIFPCPIDKELLAELNLTGEEFAEIVEQSENDDQVLERLGLPAENEDPAALRWSREFVWNRRDSLAMQAEDEGREFVIPDWAEDVRPFA